MSLPRSTAAIFHFDSQWHITLEAPAVWESARCWVKADHRPCFGPQPCPKALTDQKRVPPATALPHCPPKREARWYILPMEKGWQEWKLCLWARKGSQLFPTVQTSQKKGEFGIFFLSCSGWQLLLLVPSSCGALPAYSSFSSNPQTKMYF